ncbi:hypothetical protein MtrunA17_Chr4g0006711 [Medicago truncatula]|uniref:Uncharacterized protein n=1 Tax=Medicago truncatula TaxID=3880 RepID=A0A396I5B9_MEDTR|nr:hypothetical protein MtrunA17_Chr4g0006711 [Medicago truncatula]
MKKIIIHLKSLSKKTHVILLSSPPVNEAQIHETFSNIGTTKEDK